MAFESLSEKLQNVFKSLRSKGKLSESDVKTALKEVKMALLEADVSFKVVKQFIKSVEERAVGSEVLESLTPGQQVIKIVNEELTNLMGGKATEIEIVPSKTTVLMMAGLQGAGKTTTAAKIAGKFKQKGAKPLLVACDIYRPAAIEQLKVNAERQNVDFFQMGTSVKAKDIAKAAMEHARKENENLVIIDTAGRLQIDEEMMAELNEIKEVVDVDYTLLTVDAMTGQEAVNVAEEFANKVGIDGVILTKLDGDARGGAALSIKAIANVPIYYAGMGEKLSDLEVFHPDRMAGRILGMGDVLSLIEKAEAEFDEKKAMETADRIRHNEFNFNDYLESLSSIRKMGGLSSVISLMPGMNSFPVDQIDEKQFARIESMIFSMTPEERENPAILNISRKGRIAKGSGVDIAEVNRTVKQFEQMKKMQKQLNGMMKNNKRNKNIFGGMKLWQ